jgi:hypothetical protein
LSSIWRTADSRAPSTPTRRLPRAALVACAHPALRARPRVHRPVVQACRRARRSRCRPCPGAGTAGLGKKRSKGCPEATSTTRARTSRLQLYSHTSPG